jgi:alpha-1,6-mannosyltransferase
MLNRKRSECVDVLSQGSLLQCCAMPVVIVCTLFVIALFGLTRAAMPIVVPMYLVAFVVLLVAHRRDRLLDSFWWVLGWAVVFRLVLLWTVPDLSDDYYRYLWDGILNVQGMNPFAYVPTDPELIQAMEDAGAKSLLSEFPIEKLNSPEYYSVYPPVSQGVFTVGGAVYQQAGFVAGLIAMKAVFVLLELIGIVCMLLAMRKIGGPIRNVSLYAWNPLAIVSFAGQGHSEAGLVCGFGMLMYAAAVFYKRDVEVVAGPACFVWIGLTIAGMAKLVPFVAAPLLIRRFGWRYVIVGVVLSVAMLAPFWSEYFLPHFASSLQLYVQRFEFNAAIYSCLKAIGYAFTFHDQSKIIGPALAICFLLLAGWIWMKKPLRSFDQFSNAMGWLVSLYLLCATTIHPWYAIWMLVLLPFTDVLRRSWLWFSAVSIVTYFVYEPWGWPHIYVCAPGWIGFAWFAWRQYGDQWRFFMSRRRVGASA